MSRCTDARTERDQLVARLEAERLRPGPPEHPTTAELLCQLLDLITAECRRKGWPLPPKGQHPQ